MAGTRGDLAKRALRALREARELDPAPHGARIIEFVRDLRKARLEEDR